MIQRCAIALLAIFLTLCPLPLLLAVAPVLAYSQVPHPIAEVATSQPQHFLSYLQTKSPQNSGTLLKLPEAFRNPGNSLALQMFDEVAEKTRQLLWMLTRKLHLLVTGKMIITIEMENHANHSQDEDGLRMAKDAAVPVA
jgi:hypothetical protein